MAMARSMSAVPGVGQADDDRAAVVLGLGAGEQTARFQARHQPAERGLAERDRVQQRADAHLFVARASAGRAARRTR